MKEHVSICPLIDTDATHLASLRYYNYSKTQAYLWKTSSTTQSSAGWSSLSLTTSTPSLPEARALSPTKLGDTEETQQS